MVHYSPIVMKLIATLVLISLALFSKGQESEEISVLILQAPDLHDVEYHAEVFNQILSKTGSYNVQTHFLPADLSYNGLPGKFSDYQIIITSNLGQEMPDDVKVKFLQYLKDGGNLALIHGTIGSFQNWDKFHEIIGQGYYDGGAGIHVYWNDDNVMIKTPPYHGVGTGHTKQHEFVVKVRNPEHPIMKGMPKEWLHSKDEMFHGLRGPAKNMEVLATAYSHKKHYGSGDHEPVVWTVNYGKGRVFITNLGHVFKKEHATFIDGLNLYENKTEAVHCVGFQTLFARGVQWAATGTVTLKLPSEFPSQKGSLTLAPEEMKWSD